MRNIADSNAVEKVEKKKKTNKHHIFKYMHFYIHKNSRLFILARALQRNINL